MATADVNGWDVTEDVGEALEDLGDVPVVGGIASALGKAAQGVAKLGKGADAAAHKAKRKARKAKHKARKAKGITTTYSASRKAAKDAAAAPDSPAPKAGGLKPAVIMGAIAVVGLALAAGRK